MTDKTAIEKAKEALQNISDKAHFLRMELMACGNTERADSLCIEIRKDAMETLAAIEAERPADDLKALVYDIAIDCASIQKPKDYDVYESSAINKIGAFAESYHAEQCKACEK